MQLARSSRHPQHSHLVALLALFSTAGVSSIVKIATHKATGTVVALKELDKGEVRNETGKK